MLKMYTRNANRKVKDEVVIVVIVENVLISPCLCHSLPRGLRNVQFQLFLLLLFAENFPAHLEHRFESFLPNSSVFRKPCYRRILDGILNLLPSAAECSDFRLLDELCLRIWKRLVHDGFMAGDDIWEGHVRGGHDNFFRCRVYVGYFEDMWGIATSHQGGEPFGSALFDSYQSFCAQNSGLRINMPRERVHCYNVRGFVVPRTVLSPVCSWDFFPGIIKYAVIWKDLHFYSRVHPGSHESCIWFANCAQVLWLCSKRSFQMVMGLFACVV